MKRKDPRPRASVAAFVRGSSNGDGPTNWIHWTEEPLALVLTEDYWSNVIDARGGGPQRHDRIQLTCSMASEKPEYADIVVEMTEPGVGMKVGVLRDADTTANKKSERKR